MPKKLIITLSSARGARQLALHVAVVRLVAGVVLVAMLALLGGVVLVGWLGKTVGTLQAEIATYEARKEAAIADYQRALEAQNQQVLTLSELLRSKAGEVDQLQSAYSRLAGEFDLPFEVGKGLPGETLDQVDVTLAERRVMLGRIPSGFPVQDFTFSDGFGWRTHPVTGQRKHHDGADLSAPAGTPVYAPADGVVIFSGYDHSGYGNLLVIAHGYGFSSAYGHLQKSDVRVGEVVFRGQQIARVGNSGSSTGPHLHYEVRFLEQPLNPRPFMDWNERDFSSIAHSVRNVPWASLAELVHQEVRLMAGRSSSEISRVEAN
ncbi:MAG: peptidoglycan DD-metalloendopeptidase family protein [Pseudomonadota bacterium]